MEKNNRQNFTEVKKYAINLDKFWELVMRRSQNEKNNESTITEIWQPDADGNPSLVNKEIVDNKYDTNNNLCTLRYDFINGLISQITSVYMTPEGNLFRKENQMSFGQKIIFETLVIEGVIYEIK